MAGRCAGGRPGADELEVGVSVTSPETFFQT